MAGYTFFPSQISSDNREYFSRGINLSGADLNEKLSPAVYGKTKFIPPLQELDYYASRGFSVVRLPYLWERLQPALFGELDEAELGRIEVSLRPRRRATFGSFSLRIILAVTCSRAMRP